MVYHGRSGPRTQDTYVSQVAAAVAVAAVAAAKA